MPTSTVNVDGSNRPITLSIAEQRAHPIQTIIRINGTLFAEIEGDITNLPIGTNETLAGSMVSIKTTAVKFSPAAETVAVFTLNGAKEPHIDISTRQFVGAPTTHQMTYDIFL